MLSHKAAVYVMVFTMIALLVLGGCGPTPAPQVITQVVKETVMVAGTPEVVEKEVTKVVEVEKDINSQIYTRDFMLIDQSDMIVSFIPAMADGRAALSSGVERELQHAHEAAKEVFVIWAGKKAPSVFVTQTATKVFQSVEEAVAFFRKRNIG